MGLDVNWLKRYQRAKFTAESLWREAKDWQEKACSVSSLSLDGMPHGGARLDSFESGIVKALDLETEAQIQTQKAKKIRREIQEKLKEINDLNAYKIFTLRYLEGQSWKDIAKELNLSVDRVFHIHQDTLRKLDSE